MGSACRGERACGVGLGGEYGDVIGRHAVCSGRWARGISTCQAVPFVREGCCFPRFPVPGFVTTESDQGVNEGRGQLL